MGDYYDNTQFSFSTLPVPTVMGKRVNAHRGDLAGSTLKREVRIGKSVYIVNSCYIGKDTLSDKIRRLILRKWEDEQRQS